LKKVNMLQLAVDAARRYGLKLYGWMRFNNYGGNVQSDFFKNHPEFHEEWESGVPANKLCLAFPEVRKHKIDILVEAASYGLDGLCLGFLRHPPVLLYAPILVDGFRKEYGEEPPRDRKNRDQTRTSSVPPDDEAHQRWYGYRARFMTRFARELKEALKAKGMRDLPIAVWVRPNHCLFDGIDLDTWLEEGLCDEVVADNYARPDTCRVSPEWKEKVQAGAKLIRSTLHVNFGTLEKTVPTLIAEGYDGLCTYESDYTALQSDYIGLYESLRRDSTTAG
jgi:hypothetical protein